MGRITTSFDDALAQCQISPEGLEVWFEGGLKLLQQTPLALLRPLPLTLRASESDADDPEWIVARRFRQEILLKRKSAAAPLATGRNDELKNYYDMARSLSEIVGVCRTHGSSVMVGFEGGRSALRRATMGYLTGRPWYKWDWCDRPIGVKDMSNWIAGDEFLDVATKSGAA